MLTRLLPRDLRDSIAGDLQEEHAKRRLQRGKVSTGAWLLWTTVRLAFRFRFEAAIHGRPLPPIRDEVRKRISIWDPIEQDAVFALRMLRRQPGFTSVALFTLVLGIGANAAIFSVVDAVLWRPLPFPGSERIMSVAESRPREGRFWGPVSPTDFFDWRQRNRSFSALAAYTGTAASLTGEGEPERLRGLSVSPGFFSVLGIAPAIGRDFETREETIEQHRVVLLTHTFWLRRFAGDPAVVGRKVLLDGNSFVVAGVLPRGFWWPDPLEVVVPLALTDHDRAMRGAHFLDVVGRLQPGVSMAQAREDMSAIGAQLQ